jgi:cytochrome c oxidase assembly protein subunit 15
MLHLYSKVLAASTLLLIVAGAMVTSTGSGLAVPDWPTTYGYNMFTFPPSKWVGGILYEHGHRLIASTVGFLTIILAIWLWRTEARGWLRRLGFVALAVVIFQGILGGLTVRFFLPAPISIGHAGLAQIFFCLTVSIALFTSSGWRSSYLPDLPVASVFSRTIRDDSTLRRLTIGTTAVIYLQILLGATMRHTGAGLAIPDFPLAFGGLVPSRWDPAIATHYAHRVGAVAAALAAIATAAHVWYHHRGVPALVRPAGLLILLVAVQITLGAFVVLTRKAVPINSAHVAVGALALVTSLVLSLRAHRGMFADVEYSGSPTSLGARGTADATGLTAYAKATAVRRSVLRRRKARTTTA